MAQLDNHKLLDELLTAIPSVIGAITGWIGYNLANDTPNMNAKRFAGGVLLSGFTGGSLCILLEHMGFPNPVSAVIAASVGSSGIKGYEWLVQKAKDNNK